MLIHSVVQIVVSIGVVAILIYTFYILFMVMKRNLDKALKKGDNQRPQEVGYKENPSPPQNPQDPQGNAYIDLEELMQRRAELGNSPTEGQLPR